MPAKVQGLCRPKLNAASSQSGSMNSEKKIERERSENTAPARTTELVFSKLRFPLTAACYARRMAEDRPGNSYTQLLSLAVHEFRTPASVVSGYLRMLQRDIDQPLSGRQRKMVEEADKACGRIVALIGELSDISKIDGGSAVFKDEQFDLFQLIGEVAKEMHEAGEREVHLQPSGEAAGASITGDRVRMAAAFSVFFRAILREQPYAVTIVAERRIVRENGRLAAVVVIAREHDVQQSYKSGRSALDELRGGLGLALPVARRVIERQGGRVWAPDLGGEAGQGRQAIAVSIPLTVEPER